MTFTRRDRRDVRILLWVSLGASVISACFGYAMAPFGEPPRPPLHGAFHGVLTSLMIATPIILFELGSRRPGFLRRLRRLPLIVYFSVKVLFYSVVIITGLLVMRPSSSPSGHAALPLAGRIERSRAPAGAPSTLRRYTKSG